MGWLVLNPNSDSNDLSTSDANTDTNRDGNSNGDCYADLDTDAYNLPAPHCDADT